MVCQKLNVILELKGFLQEIFPVDRNIHKSDIFLWPSYFLPKGIRAYLLSRKCGKCDSLKLMVVKLSLKSLTLRVDPLIAIMQTTPNAVPHPPVALFRSSLFKKHEELIGGANLLTHHRNITDKSLTRKFYSLLQDNFFRRQSDVTN